MKKIIGVIFLSLIIIGNLLNPLYAQGNLSIGDLKDTLEANFPTKTDMSSAIAQATSEVMQEVGTKVDKITVNGDSGTTGSTVKFVSGTNVTITREGDTVEIASSGGGSTDSLEIQLTAGENLSAGNIVAAYDKKIYGSTGYKAYLDSHFNSSPAVFTSNFNTISTSILPHVSPQYSNANYGSTGRNFVFVYSDGSNMKTRVASISGTPPAITWNALTNDAYSGLTTDSRLIRYGDNVAFFYKASTSYYCKIGTVSGTTVTWGSAGSIFTDAAVNDWSVHWEGGSSACLITTAGNSSPYFRKVNLSSTPPSLGGTATETLAASGIACYGVRGITLDSNYDAQRGAGVILFQDTGGGFYNSYAVPINIYTGTSWLETYSKMGVARQFDANCNASWLNSSGKTPLAVSSTGVFVATSYNNNQGTSDIISGRISRSAGSAAVGQSYVNARISPVQASQALAIGWGYSNVLIFQEFPDEVYFIGNNQSSNEYQFRYGSIVDFDSPMMVVKSTVSSGATATCKYLRPNQLIEWPTTLVTGAVYYYSARTGVVTKANDTVTVNQLYDLRFLGSAVSTTQMVLSSRLGEPIGEF